MNANAKLTPNAKTKSATDLMTGAPLAVDQAALDVVGLMLKPKT